MLEMKLPMRTAEEGGGDTAEDEQEQTDCNVHIRGSVSQAAPNRHEDSARGLRFPHQLDKETVFEWFGLHLNPAKRIEFMCGLLHMCQPLELRFLGACLEDLARKDFHVLRDFEIRANSSNDLGLLTDVVDPVVRSKLLVCLSLLGSENRECAGILFRILSHVDPALYFKNYGFPVSSCRDPQHLQFHPQCEDGDEYGKSDQSCGPPAEAGVGPLEQLALLFTMASLHPAFPFHQRENFRIQLDKVDVAIEEERENYQHGNNALSSGDCTCCASLPLHTSGTVHADKNKFPKTDYLSPSTEGSLSDGAQLLHPCQSPSRKPQREAVHIERIVLKGISRSREYSFEVKWSDASSSHVTKTHHDLENFLLKLPKELSTESFEKGILSLLRQGDQCESREVERTLKEKFLSAPQSFRQTGKVCGFFLLESSGPNYNRCNPVPVGKPFQEYCSEASSQEEGVYLEPYPQGHRKKPGSKSPSLGIPSSKGSQAESRRTPFSEHNGAPDWRRKGCSLKLGHEACGLCPEQLYRGEVKGSSIPGNKTIVRAPVTDREKGKKMEGRLGYVPNGIMRAAPVQLLPQPSGKDLRLDVGSGQDTYGETSSESYSSPSSPRHDGRESLESEDEKDGDTDSHSDDSTNGKRDSFLPCKGMGGAAVATVHPLVPVPLKEVHSRLESSLGAPKFPLLAFMHPLPYAVQNGTAGPEAADSVVGEGPLAGGPVAGGDADKQTPDPSPLLPAFGGQLQGPQQPLVQRFKTAAPPTGTESCGAPAHQLPVGAISFPPPGPTYASPLQPAYPPAEPAMSSGQPPSLPLAETHPKAPGLPLPSGLRPSYSLPPPTTVIPSVGALGAPAASQVQAMVPPVVPTHTPGPAPSPSPALTHSTAQSDSTSYINSTSCGSAGGASQQQQQQPTPSQQIGCGTCGCRGSCGSGHAPNYFFPPQLPRQVISVPPIFHLTSLCSSSYLNQAHQSNGATQLPFFPHGPGPYASVPPPPPLLHSHSDHVLGTQAGYGLQQMAAFNRFYQPMYPSVSMMPSSSSMALGMKKNGNISCYNCGVSGHFAQDCKQPSIDAAQKGGFRLKYVTPHSSEALDNAD